MNEERVIIDVLECSFAGINMNAIHHDHKNCKFEETYAGCLGRMVNLLESNIGVPANRLLNDKMHGDGTYSFYSFVLCFFSSFKKLDFSCMRCTVYEYHCIFFISPN